MTATTLGGYPLESKHAQETAPALVTQQLENFRTVHRERAREA
jgi:hypothetical protein